MLQPAVSSVSCQNIFNPFPIRVVETLRRMRGGCQPHMMRGEDENYYVVKSPDNPQGGRTLVNELLYSLVALDLHLPVAEPAIVFVDQALIHCAKELYFERPSLIRMGSDLNRWRASLCYGSKCPQNPCRVICPDFLPDSELEHLENRPAFAGALLLDQWFGNSDARQAVFYRRTPYSPFRAVFIDHGLSFSGHKWTLDAKPLASLFRPVFVYAAVRTLDDFEPWLSQAESFAIQRLQSFISIIPPEWFSSDFARLSSLLVELIDRKAILRRLLSSLCSNTPKAFPNWQINHHVSQFGAAICATKGRDSTSF